MRDRHKKTKKSRVQPDFAPELRHLRSRNQNQSCRASPGLQIGTQHVAIPTKTSAVNDLETHRFDLIQLLNEIKFGHFPAEREEDPLHSPVSPESNVKHRQCVRCCHHTKGEPRASSRIFTTKEEDENAQRFFIHFFFSIRRAIST